MSNFIKTLAVGFLIGFVIFLVFFTIDVLRGGDVSFDKNLLINFGYYQLYSVVLTLANGYYFDYLNHTVKWEKYAKYRLLIGALGGVVVTMFSIFLIRMITHVGI